MEHKVFDVLIIDSNETELVEKVLEKHLGDKFKGSNYFPNKNLLKVSICESVEAWETAVILRSSGYLTQYKGLKKVHGKELKVKKT